MRKSCMDCRELVALKGKDSRAFRYCPFCEMQVNRRMHCNAFVPKKKE